MSVADLPACFRLKLTQLKEYQGSGHHCCNGSSDAVALASIGGLMLISHATSLSRQTPQPTNLHMFIIDSYSEGNF